MLTLTVDRIFGASLRKICLVYGHGTVSWTRPNNVDGNTNREPDFSQSQSITINENINYDSLAKSPTSQLQEIAWIGKTNRGPDFESQA